MIESIIKPLRPTGVGWERLPDASPHVSMGYECHDWYHRPTGIRVLSAVEVAKDKDGIDRGPEYHVSVSKWNVRASGPCRVSTTEANWMLRQFGLDGAEEDNHVPSGIARNFWRTVAEPMIGLECACKADEPAIVEDRGDYVWRP